MLLKKGKNEGFITYAELNENLPEGVIEADRLEEIVEMISDMGISVQEHANKASDGESGSNDQEVINPIENEIGKTTDPVRMYMREMGTIELLDREGEIVIAKKIEDGNNKIQETLSSFLPVLIFIQERYQTAWEVKQKHIIDMAADRGKFICQSQSLNLFVEAPNYKLLSSMHFYGWKRGLKTGMYYLRTRPSSKALQFTIEPDKVCESCSG